MHMRAKQDEVGGMFPLCALLVATTMHVVGASHLSPEKQAVDDAIPCVLVPTACPPCPPRHERCLLRCLLSEGAAGPRRPAVLLPCTHEATGRRGPRPPALLTRPPLSHRQPCRRA